MVSPLTKGYLALRPDAAAGVLARLETADANAVLESVPPTLAAKVLQEMAPGPASQCIAQLPPEIASEILARVRTVESVAVLRLLGREHVKTLLASMPRPAAARLWLRLRAPETVVGAIVDADVVTLKLEDHAADALRRLRHAGQRLGQTVAVLGERRELAGIVELGDLLVARDRSVCQRLMRPAIHVLNGRTPIRSAIEHPGWSVYDSLPVINRNGVFQGVLWRSAIEDEERRSLVEGEERTEIATTRGALAEIFWICVGAFVPAHNHRATRDQAAD